MARVFLRGQNWYIDIRIEGKRYVRSFGKDVRKASKVLQILKRWEEKRSFRRACEDLALTLSRERATLPPCLTDNTPTNTPLTDTNYTSTQTE